MRSIWADKCDHNEACQRFDTLLSTCFSRQLPDTLRPLYFSLLEALAQLARLVGWLEPTQSLMYASWSATAVSCLLRRILHQAIVIRQRFVFIDVCKGRCRLWRSTRMVSLLLAIESLFASTTLTPAAGFETELVPAMLKGTEEQFLALRLVAHSPQFCL